jgi:hypothetical protein
MYSSAGTLAPKNLSAQRVSAIPAEWICFAERYACCLADPKRPTCLEP